MGFLPQFKDKHFRSTCLLGVNMCVNGYSSLRQIGDLLRAYPAFRLKSAGNGFGFPTILMDKSYSQ